MNIGLGCFAILWSLVTLIFDCFIGYSWYGQLRSQNYPTIEGRILRSEVSRQSGEDGTTYGVDVEFEYTINGTRHVGTKHRYGAMHSSDRDPAQDFVKKHPAGSKVTVYYHPDDPADAVLVTGLQGMDYFMALFMTPFNVVMFGIWVALFSEWYHARRNSPAGGVPILRKPYGVHLRLPKTSALAAAGLTALLISFVSIFVVVLAFGIESSPNIVRYIWLGMLVCSTLVYLWQRFRTGSGLNDLIIDLERNTFSLPQTFGRDGSKEYPLDSIVDVRLDSEIRRGNKGSGHTVYHPKLIFIDAEGAERKETLIEWYSESRARSLVDWLSQRIEPDSS